MRFFVAFRVVLLVWLFIPVAAFATQVGFVPSTGIWFSRTDLSPGETIRVYTAVVNSEYYAINGVVAFYNNDEIIDTVDVKLLKKDEARQLRVFWEPTEGDHRVSAKFTKVETVDEKGVVTPLTLTAVTGVTGAPLTLSSGATTPLIGETTLSVEKKDDRLVLAPAIVLGAKIAAVTGSVSTSPIQAAIDKNKALLGEAEQIAGRITSTAGKVEHAYITAKSWVSTGKEWYSKTKEQIQKAGPVANAMYIGWLRVTNDNDPKRIGIIVAVTFVMWFTAKWLLRRKAFYDDL